MKFSHTVKFPFGRKFEMHEFSAEVEDTEFPELVGVPFSERARFMQGHLLQLGLIFQVASGYISPESIEFKENWRLAAELKGTPSKAGQPKKFKAV